MTDDKAILGQQVGARLREARLAALLTVRAAAKQIGMDHSTLVRFENGELLPSLFRLMQLARVYQTTLSALVASDAQMATIIRDLEQASPEVLEHFGSLQEK
jgi:transcriptional regulator with XRE-family HTH domain